MVNCSNGLLCSFSPFFSCTFFFFFSPPRWVFNLLGLAYTLHSLLRGERGREKKRVLSIHTSAYRFRGNKWATQLHVVLAAAAAEEEEEEERRKGARRSSRNKKNPYMIAVNGSSRERARGQVQSYCLVVYIHENTLFFSSQCNGYNCHCRWHGWAYNYQILAIHGAPTKQTPLE